MNDERQTYGYIPDVYRLICKYNLSDYLKRYLETSIFPSKYAWKKILKQNIIENDHIRMSVSLTSFMEEDQVIHVFKLCKPCRIWQICRERPEMKSQCQTVVSVLAKLFSFSRPEVCTKCDNLVENKVEHIINYCV